MRGSIATVGWSSAVALLCAVPVTAQHSPSPPDRITLDPPSWAKTFVAVERDASPLVGLALAVPMGSGADPDGRPGAGQVAASAVVSAVETRLGSGMAEGHAEVTPDRTVLTFLVRPERAAELIDAIDAAAFGAGPSPASVAEARADRAEALRFELGSPVRDMNVERRAMLYGRGDPRTRPPDGTLAAVDSLTDAEIDGMRRTLFRRGQARVVAVGPIHEDRPVIDAPAGSTAPGLAWEVGDRRSVVREVTNSWISVAFPVPADLPRAAVLYVVDRMARDLDATPPDPGLFNSSVELVEMPEGEVILVRVAVLPEAAPRFETRILGLPEKIAAARDPAFFRFFRGQFRAGHLVALAPPEAAATHMAVELLTRGRILDFDEAVWDLDVGSAADAATALGSPRVLVFGPDLGG